MSNKLAMPQVQRWLQRNWFPSLQSAGIIVTLGITLSSMNSDTKSRRAGMLLEITRSHREIWEKFLVQPELFRVMKPDADLKAEPVTDEERLAVQLLILHLNSVYQAVESGATVPIDGMQNDIQSFFALPIPKHIWERARHFQNSDFTAFVEKNFASPPQLYAD